MLEEYADKIILPADVIAIAGFSEDSEEKKIIEFSHFVFPDVDSLPKLYATKDAAEKVLQDDIKEALASIGISKDNKAKEIFVRFAPDIRYHNDFDTRYIGYYGRARFSVLSESS